ncbi:hypothetical protein [Candidatus Cardinium sp. cByotN1]|uniref:hypothetical protein n=1 Tax=Candidatus Cardinium sp. cByotN1 TaxID=2699439 RepID=UPI001FB31479|nr:hypothetical protein [Candidatus Cardinium sp. cByotN1]
MSLINFDLTPSSSRASNLSPVAGLSGGNKAKKKRERFLLSETRIFFLSLSLSLSRSLSSYH